jgi:DnaK suppressor protein
VRAVFSDDVIKACQSKLLNLKSELLNRVRQAHKDFVYSEKTGDEGDQSSAHIEEHSFLVNQERLRNQLTEIESALARIEQGRFGICEETEGPIEQARLLAIPWTRFSIEGAELRESIDKRYAR